MEEAFRKLIRLDEIGIKGLTMSVNASAMQLQGDLDRKLERLLKRYNIPPEQVKVEISEKDALTGSRETIDVMHRIRAMGVKLAMDDFGAGHTSVLHLKEYEFDTVKIDGSLVKDILSNPVSSEIIASIVSLGKSLNFTVLAEYVETEGERQLLENLGCLVYQGYLFSPALSGDDLESYLLSGNSTEKKKN